MEWYVSARLEAFRLGERVATSFWLVSATTSGFSSGTITYDPDRFSVFGEMICLGQDKERAGKRASAGARETASGRRGEVISFECPEVPLGPAAEAEISTGDRTSAPGD